MTKKSKYNGYCWDPKINRKNGEMWRWQEYKYNWLNNDLQARVTELKKKV